jgi:hypothetical protein
LPAKRRITIESKIVGTSAWPDSVEGIGPGLSAADAKREEGERLGSFIEDFNKRNPSKTKPNPRGMILVANMEDMHFIPWDYLERNRKKAKQGGFGNLQTLDSPETKLAESPAMMEDSLIGGFTRLFQAKERLNFY